MQTRNDQKDFEKQNGYFKWVREMVARPFQ
jgi:hypothetical protein